MQQNQNPKPSQPTMEDEHQHSNPTAQFTASTDICAQLLHRYASSTAPQHRHLLATACATRSILESQSLPLTPHSYFTAAIANLDATSSDATTAGAVLSFLAVVVPIAEVGCIERGMAVEAVRVLVGVLERDGMGMSSVRNGVKCLGELLVGVCGDWEVGRVGFERLLEFSVDRRPKVRRCAQECLEKVIKSLQYSAVIKDVSKLILSFFRKCMKMALKLNPSMPADGSNSEYVEALHILSVLNLIGTRLSTKIGSKIITELSKLLSSGISGLANNTIRLIETLLNTLGVEVSDSVLETIIISLVFYVSEQGIPGDTIISAAKVLKDALNKLRSGDSRSWAAKFPLVCSSVAGLLNSEATTASEASSILVELIDHNIDQTCTIEDNELSKDENQETNAIKSMCEVLKSALCASDAMPNKHILEVTSVLFLKLGKLSYLFMKDIVLKLADLMRVAIADKSETVNLQECIGSSIAAMGPEMILQIVPISHQVDDLTCQNAWLIPVLRNYVVGASLGYYMDHIVPLAETFNLSSRRVKRPGTVRDLQAYARGLWELLPAFCRHSTDTCQVFGRLTEFIIPLLKKDSFMHEPIAVALKMLVTENKGATISDKDACQSNISSLKKPIVDSRFVLSLSKEAATENIKALSSHSSELLQVLTDLFIDSPVAKRKVLKEAVRCLVSVTNHSVTHEIFMSSLKRFQSVDGDKVFESLGNQKTDVKDIKGSGNICTSEEDEQRRVLLEFASSLGTGAGKDLVNVIYAIVKRTLEASNETCHFEAYQTLRRLLEEHEWFLSTRFAELTELLVGLKSTADVDSLKSRFSVYHLLMVHALQMSEEDENTQAFLILNEIIVALKNVNEDARKAAYDALLVLGSSLRELACPESDGPYQKLIHMMMGYLSGSSPQIKSGAISALSVLVYSNIDICILVPELVNSVLSLLQTKALEVIKAALGFLKVFVSGLESEDLQNFVNEVVNGILPWSPVSRHHFRSKVTVILEIMIRKCGPAAVDSVAPEKYKGFLKSILENRHEKTGSQVAYRSDIKKDFADQATNRSWKKTYKEPSDSVGFVKQKKRSRENKHNSSVPGSIGSNISACSDDQPKSFKKARYSVGKKDRPKNMGENRNVKRKSSDGDEGRAQQRNTNKKEQLGTRGSPAASKPLKRKSFGNRGKK